MKQPYLKNRNFRLVICFTLLGVAFVIHSCKKDGGSNKEQPATANPVINLAKVWYDATYSTVSNSKLSTQSTGSTIQDWSKTFSPYWAKANTFMIDSLTFIELPALKRGDMAMSLKPRTDPGRFNFSTSGSLTSLIIVNKSGTFYIYAMTIVADSSYLKGNYGKVSNNTYRHRDKDFSGMVFYNRLDGSFVNGWQYTNGQITGVVTQTPVTANSTVTSRSKQTGITGNSAVRAINYGNKTQPDVAESCTTTITTTYWEDCSYYVDDVNDEYPFNCYIYTTQSSSTSCVPNPPSPGGSAPPPPCSAGPPPGESVVGIHEISDVAAPPPNSGGIVDQANQIGVTPCPSDPAPKPPIDTSKTKDPCARVAAINAMAANAVIAKQNSTILSETVSGGLEYGVNQNLNSLTGNTFVNTSITAGTTTTWQPTFTWDPINGYTLGYSHGHPDGNPPSPQDVIALMNPIGNNHELISAGQSAIQFYEKNASVTSVTTNGMYLVTINDWTTMQNIYSSSYSTQAQTVASLANYENYVKTYLTNVQDATPADASAYALMQVFQNSVTIYYAPPDSTNFMPLTTTMIAGNNTITTLQCPQ